MNHRIQAAAATLLCTLLAAGPAIASEHASKDEAVAMVKKGVAFWKANGDDKTFAAIDAKDNSQFHDRDLYLVVYGLDGTVRAHGQNAKKVGKNMLDEQDVDGKLFVKERVEMAQKQPSFWQDYKYTDPTTKKIAPKQMYCERVDNSVLCGGIYK